MSKLYSPVWIIRRWGLWEVTSFRWGREGKTHDGISALAESWERASSFTLSAPWVLRRNQQCATGTRALIRTWLCWHLDPELPASRTVRNISVVCKLPSLWYFHYGSPNELREGKDTACEFPPAFGQIYLLGITSLALLTKNDGGGHSAHGIACHRNVPWSSR